MEKSINNLLKELENRAATESQIMSKLSSQELDERIDEFLLPIGRDTGNLVNMMIKMADAKTIVEIGSSYGYSTIWLAEAARETSGIVYSLEINPDKQAHAREFIERVGLNKQVTFLLGDAMELIGTIKAKFDFVLIDLWKSMYIPCFELCYPKLSNGALVIADNMLYPESAK